MWLDLNVCCDTQDLGKEKELRLPDLQPIFFLPNMPIYEYHCEECGSDFELLVRQGKAPECPECSSPRLSKQWSTFAAKAEGGSTPSTSSHSDGAGCGCCGGGACGLN